MSDPKVMSLTGTMFDPPSVIYIVIVPVTKGLQLCGAHMSREQAELFAQRLHPKGEVIQYRLNEVNHA